MHRVAIIAAVSTVSLGSCSGDNDTDRLPEVAQIPTVSRQIELNKRAVTLADPVFRVGSSDAEGPTAFGRVNGGVIDAMERVWVADDLAGHIVRLDRDGNVADVIGRRGSGPGEFQQVEILGWRGARVVTYDVEQRRTVAIDPTTDESYTTLLSSTRWSSAPRHMSGMGSSDENVFIPLDQPRREGDNEGWAEYPPARVVVERQDGSSMVVLSGPYALRTYFDGRRYLLHPLQTRVVASVHRDTVALVGTIGGDIIISPLDGTNPQAFSLGEEPGLELTNETLEWVQEFLDELSPQQRRFWMSKSLVAEADLPARRPLFDRLVHSTDGVMWVRRTEEAPGEFRSWLAVTMDGTHLGTVHLPSGEDVFAAGPTLVATLSRDRNGASIVSLHEHPFGRGGSD